MTKVCKKKIGTFSFLFDNDLTTMYSLLYIMISALYVGRVYLTKSSSPIDFYQVKNLTECYYDSSYPE